MSRYCKINYNAGVETFFLHKNDLFASGFPSKNIHLRTFETFKEFKCFENFVPIEVTK